jgi:signal transduction histidine kinase
MCNQILLVDDEEGICKILSISLQDSGYEVFTACNGEHALEIFLEKKPPIVLTDIKMPGMDGIELLRRIKRENPETEVIMITGHGDMNLAIKSLKHEATDFVTKPINDDVLEIALKRAKERILMRQQLRKYTENLERMVEEKTRQLLDAERMAAMGETVSGLAHAIKNIAGSLKGGVFVLDKGLELDNKQYLQEGWRMIKENVGKIRNLSMDLLNYGKSTEIHFQVSDPNHPPLEVFKLLSPQAKEYGILMVTKLDPNLEPFLFDPEGIYRCLLTIASNALDSFKATSLMTENGDPIERMEKEKKVIIESCKIDGWAVEYRISDTGAGMTEKVRDKIFQSFFSTKGTEGTGIGLMMAQKIIEQHHGVIAIESELGKGSAFIIRLPKHPEPLNVKNPKPV